MFLVRLALFELFELKKSSARSVTWVKLRGAEKWWPGGEQLDTVNVRATTISVSRKARLWNV